ncbi:MAG: ThuA domain-containing protein [Verrucomicrobiota bacterium]
MKTSNIEHPTLTIEFEKRLCGNLRRWMFSVGCSMFLFSIFASAAEAPKPLRALLITGGCCHDYEAQKKTLTEGITARANVTWTIIHEGGDGKEHKFSIYDKPDWTKGYDVIVHNECSGKVIDVPFIEKMARAQTNGVGVVMIHCAVHSYRDAETDEWRKLLGVSSYRHQKKGAFDVINVKSEHPIMKSWPAKFHDPEDELYEIKKVWPNCIPLAKSLTPTDEKDEHPCIWINTFGKSRVFATTLGHLNDTMKLDIYLDLVTRGLLWSCNKLEKDGSAKTGFGKK